MASNGQAMTTLGTAGTNDCATTTSLHADAKAVRALAANNRGLKSAFHFPLPVKGLIFHFTN
jgi:hypothetical protein